MTRSCLWRRDRHPALWAIKWYRVGLPGGAVCMAEERLQRRLAAILSADVVGYSRLMGTDEAGTLARLKAMRRDLVDPLSPQQILDSN